MNKSKNDYVAPCPLLDALEANYIAPAEQVDGMDS